MTPADPQAFRRHRDTRASMSEVACTLLLLASLGAITWAIRGTSGWGGMDGTLVPGLTWGVLWWYVCWRRGIDARGIPLWLGLGISLGGELGYGQYVSWIRGMFNVGDEVIPISPWIGYAWFAVCGIGWAAPGAIALGWALSGQVSLKRWLARLVVPVGAAILTRYVVQTWPWLYFPHWELGFYTESLSGEIDPTTALKTQQTMILVWLVAVGLCCFAAFVHGRQNVSIWMTRGLTIGSVVLAMAGLIVVSDWLFFPSDQLGMFAGELDKHLGRTVYTNAQNAIVVGWWLGALLVAALTRDRHTLVAGAVVGGGFGVGFPLSAVWCLGYGPLPELIDWWKMWELNSGFNLGLLYVPVLYWAMRQVDGEGNAVANDGDSTFRRLCETAAIATGVFLIVYVNARDYFPAVGVLLGLMFVVAMLLTLRVTEDSDSRRRAVSFLYSALLLIFMLTWGASSQAGILLGLYDAAAVDQYDWPSARMAIFTPFALLIVGVALLTLWRTVRNPLVGLPSRSETLRINARMVDLMTFTGVVGAISIWPAKISVLYAIFLGLALFAFNRLSICLDCVDELAE